MKSYISYVLSVMIIVKKHIGKYLFPYIFLLFCVYRVLRLERKFSYKIDADWFFLKQGILEDSLILGSCLLLYMMIYSVKNRGLEIIGKIIISICFFVYCLDIILFKIMGTRLLVSDVVKLSGDIDDVVSVILQMALSLDGMSIVIFSVILLYTCCLFISKKNLYQKK